MATEQAKTKEYPVRRMSAFLESTSPGQLVEITDLIVLRNSSKGLDGNAVLNKEDIRLYCNNESCSGTRFFRCTDKSDKYIYWGKEELFYIKYLCSNCQQTTKSFSLFILVEEDIYKENVLSPGYYGGKAYKFGELPSFGPNTPNRLLELIGSDRSLFLKGRTSENQGLGIGAFAYYRRVVENQKNRIINKVLTVAQKIGAEKEVIEQLQQAIQETQFTKALSLVKSGIPQSLLINGHNPFLLLHSALSEGLHGHTDEECLELATSIRIVLSELSERLAQAIKDDAEVSKALQTLINKRVGK